tara:strand:+ start:845 stop:2497 length:1653 start_codon:yes stop_codon:yes gene_type:complete
MARDRELVSDVDRNRALLDIIEHVRDCKIKFSSGYSSKVSDDGITDGIQKYKITLASPAVKGVESFTALNHECFHILFESEFKIIHRIIKDWTNNGQERNKATYYKYAINLLEDQRIESLGGQLWLGTGKRFEKMREKRGEILQKEQKGKSKDVSPADLLLYIRFKQGEKYSSNKYFLAMKQALGDVELTGNKGSIKVMLKIKPLLDEWWEDNSKDGFDPTPIGNRVRGNDTNNWIGKEASPQNMNVLQYDMSNDNIDEEIKKEKEVGQDVMDEVNDKINQTTYDKEDLSYVKFVERGESYAIYNESISDNMRKLFRKLTMIPKEIINDQGNEVDIESYITNRIEGKNLNRCLIDKKTQQGVCVLISVDVSHSMNNDDKIEMARKLVGTLFKSVEDLKNVEVKAQTWSSGSDGRIHIQEINNFKETKYITTGMGGMTPTHLAIKYASMTAKKMKGDKKLIIMLTDGHPQYYKNNFKLHLNQLITMSQKSMIKALRQTPNIMCVLVGSGLYIGVMTQIFGAKRFIHTASMDEASETVIKKFRQLIMRTMLR